MLALLGMATVAAAGGLTAAEAHVDLYHNIDVTILDYQRTPYNGFDLIQIDLSIENLETFIMDETTFVLGGPAQYREDPTDNPDTEITGTYSPATYSDVRGRGGEVSIHDCSAADRWNDIPTHGTGEAALCFMVGKSFVPDGIRVVSTGPGHAIVDRGRCYATSDDHDPNTTIRSSSYTDYYFHDANGSCDTYNMQVIPFHDESVFCFDNWRQFCNADNVQPIDGTVVTRPAPEPEPTEPAHATLLYSIYNNGTGTLTLVFSELVVANNPDRIELIYDISTYVDSGTAPDLGDAELRTVDNKRQSKILAFELGDELRQEVAESLRTHGDLALVIETRAIYAADGFTDITSDVGEILVTDLVVVR